MILLSLSTYKVSYDYSYDTSPIASAIFLIIISVFLKKGNYVLWQKLYIPHVIIEYDLYPLSLVN